MISIANSGVLIVGQNLRNQVLLEEFVRKLGYEVVRADTMSELKTMVHRTYPLPARFALVDITGFDHTIWELCGRLNEVDVPVLVISPRQSDEVQQLSYSHGAQKVMEKPLVMKVLADTIHGFMHSDE